MPSKRRPGRQVKNSKDNALSQLPLFQNGLSDVLGVDLGSAGTQLQQIDTLFRNNRWYLISNMRQPLNQIYVEHGLVQTLVDVPVDDGMRGGFAIKTKQLDEEQLHELETEYHRQQLDQEVLGQGIKWGRLFGGAGVIVMTDQDPASPLALEKIREDSPLEWRACDMWELFYDKQNMPGIQTGVQILSDKATNPNHDYFNYNGVKLHKSRVKILQGVTPPSFIKPRLRGWGLSVLEGLIASINQYVKSNELIFEVLDEFKVDIFKMDGLNSTLLSALGNRKISERIALATRQKNFKNAITLDGKDDYIQKQLTFSGIAEMMKEFRIQIASDMRMPLTKLFGLSATGFNSGEDDIENYNSMVESQVRSKANGPTVWVLQALCQKLFGMIPDDLQIIREPLRVLSSEQLETVKTQKFNRVVAAYEKGLISQRDAKEAMNRDELLPVQVDPDEDTSLETQAEGEEAQQVAQMAAELGVNDPKLEQQLSGGPGEDEGDPDSDESDDESVEDEEDDEEVANANFAEEKHKRAGDGKFGSGGGGADKGREKSKRTGKEIGLGIGPEGDVLQQPVTREQMKQLSSDFKDYTTQQYEALKTAKTDSEREKIRKQFQKTHKQFSQAAEKYESRYGKAGAKKLQHPGDEDD